MAGLKGSKTEGNLYAAAYASQRKYDKALSIKRAAPAPVSSTDRLQDVLFRLVIALDQGHWRQVKQHIDPQVSTPADLSASDAGLLADAGTAVRMALAPTNERKALLDAAIRRIAATSPANTARTGLAHDQRLLFHAWLAAYYGDPATAAGLIGKLGDLTRIAEYPATAKLLGLVESTIMAHRGDPAGAIRKLQASVDGTEYCITHLVLMDLYAQNKDFSSAREQAAWLAKHRGRVHVEAAAGEAFVPFNVYQSTLANAHFADYSLRLDDQAAARKALADLRAAWSQQDMPAELLRLASRLEKESRDTTEK